jgi:hypothetical protein
VSKMRHSLLPSDPAHGLRGTRQKGYENGTSQAEILSVAQTAKARFLRRLRFQFTFASAEHVFNIWFLLGILTGPGMDNPTCLCADSETSRGSFL